MTSRRPSGRRPALGQDREPPPLIGVPGLELGLTRHGAITAREYDGALVAVVLVPPDDAEGDGVRRRLDALLEVDDPHLVHVRRVVPTLDGGLAVVSDLPVGPSLTTAVGVGALRPDAVERLLRDLALGLDALHGRGLVHGRLAADDVVLAHGGARLGGLVPREQGARAPSQVAPERRPVGGAAAAAATPASDVWELAALVAAALGETRRVGAPTLDPAVAGVLDDASVLDARARPTAAEVADVAGRAVARRDGAGPIWGALAPDREVLDALAREAAREVVLLAPTRRAGRRGRTTAGRPPRRRFAAVGAAALGAAAAAIVVAGPPQLGSGDVGEAAIAPSSIAQAFARRDAALEQRSLPLLATAVAPGTRAWHRDTRLVLALQREGIRLGGVRTVVGPGLGRGGLALGQAAHVRDDGVGRVVVGPQPATCVVAEMSVAEVRPGAVGLRLTEWGPCG
ncbi:hypothetical protein C8046_03375 [Serinibacter arcticus]|uniref:Protein kinase domain-containing protein n=1 Tax=Serinibacter arcticus TaxID=1655435 RepID=A0A2U1ZSA5_9MICO|nr:hypothetical protein [Serinibacter arcticus]PWD49867.1 hypothetical protein C8046_03375 [Serinibacter arcticus]